MNTSESAIFVFRRNNIILTVLTPCNNPKNESHDFWCLFDEKGSYEQITQVMMNVFKTVCLAAHSPEAAAIGGILAAVSGGVPEYPRVGFLKTCLTEAIFFCDLRERPGLNYQIL